MQKESVNMKGLTHDECNLLCIYSGGTRSEALEKLRSMKQYLESDEVELLQMTDSVLQKLDSMTDGEFSQIDLVPDFTPYVV